MKRKTALKLITDKVFAFFNSISLGRRINEHIISSAFETTMEIEHKDDINFCIPNGWARVRAINKNQLFRSTQQTYQKPTK